LDILLWENTQEDIESKIKLKLGFEQAKSAQNFQILATVASKALGGGEKETAPPQNFRQAEQQLAAVFGKKG